MLTWQWGRGELAKAFFAFGVQSGKKVSWLVALRDKVDEIRISIEENLPQARALIQGRRRLVESDRAFVFLCSRPMRSLDENLPVSLRIFLKKFGVLPAHVTLFHVNQISVAETEGDRRLELHNLGRNIVSISLTYGYMEQPDIRGALRELQARGDIDIPSERWIIVIGEEELIITDDLPFLRWLRVSLFRFILHLSTPAHKFFGLDYDAGVTKEVIPVVFSPVGVKVTLPELEIVETGPVPRPAIGGAPGRGGGEVISSRG
jgi:KUP system potassium uptake protein